MRSDATRRIIPNWCYRRRNRGPSQAEIDRRSERRYLQPENHRRVSDRRRRVRVSSRTIPAGQANPRQRSPDRHLWVEMWWWKESLIDLSNSKNEDRYFLLLFTVTHVALTPLNDKIITDYEIQRIRVQVMIELLFCFFSSSHLAKWRKEGVFLWEFGQIWFNPFVVENLIALSMHLWFECFL